MMNPVPHPCCVLFWAPSKIFNTIILKTFTHFLNLVIRVTAIGLIYWNPLEACYAIFLFLSFNFNWWRVLVRLPRPFTVNLKPCKLVGAFNLPWVYSGGGGNQFSKGWGVIHSKWISLEYFKSFDIILEIKFLASQSSELLKTFMPKLHV